MNDPAAYGREFADIYDQLFPAGSQAEQVAARLAQWHLGDGAPALEFGVGTGRIALPLAERSGEVVGVDASPEMLKVLGESLAATPRPVTPVIGDIREYADEREYGLVYCVCATLSIILDRAGQQSVIERAARRLAPGAMLVVETHNPAAVEALHGDRARECYFIPYPAPDTGLLSFSMLDRDSRIWQLSHVWFQDGRSRVTREVSRLTTPAEIDEYADHAGLTWSARYGDWQSSPFQGHEPTVISVYRRD